MATIRCIEEIEAWQNARQLVKEIYRISNQRLFSGDLILKSQIRKAAISIMSNIAEGFERNGNREFFQFLSIAKGSIGEVKSQIYTALDQQYIDQETFQQTMALITETAKRISGMMNYLHQSKLKGSKYRPPTNVHEL